MSFIIYFLYMLLELFESIKDIIIELLTTGLFGVFF